MYMPLLPTVRVAVGVRMPVPGFSLKTGRKAFLKYSNKVNNKKTKR
jgi:hypothetical protein